MSRFSFCFLFLLVPLVSKAQNAPPSPPPTPPISPPTLMSASTPTATENEGLTILDSSVGYIDNPTPADQIYLRSDSGYSFRFPNRAEFFYAQPQPRGPGLSKPERSISYTDIVVGLEKKVGARASLFAEIPTRFLNPEINNNASGLSDVSAGFKYQLWKGPATSVSFQLRTYTPSGNASSGLGTGHVSLEPALLAAHAATNRLTILSEFRVWTPVAGTDFAGEVLRYGLGGRYDLYRSASGVRIAPTLEFVGWEVLNGKQSGLSQSIAELPTSAAGTSVLNVKVGSRIDWGNRMGFYAGYGRAITGERWYADIFRVELRLLF